MWTKSVSEGAKVCVKNGQFFTLFFVREIVRAVEDFGCALCVFLESLLARTKRQLARELQLSPQPIYKFSTKGKSFARKTFGKDRTNRSDDLVAKFYLAAFY